MGIIPEIYVNAKTSFESYRGHPRVMIAYVDHWQHLDREELDYLVKQILYPFCGRVVLVTPLMRELL
jgi:hypothetical protein